VQKTRGDAASILTVFLVGCLLLCCVLSLQTTGS
jgi:hypothetical protein